MVAIRKTTARPDIRSLRRGKTSLITSAATAGARSNGSDPEAAVARFHQGWVQTQGQFVVGGILETVEIAGHAQVEFGIKAEGQSGDDSNGKRDQQSGAVHAGFVYPTHRQMKSRRTSVPDYAALGVRGSRQRPALRPAISQ